MDERIKFRVICPKCQTPRNTRVLATKEVGYDSTVKQFHLICDDPKCGGARLVAKEGDSLGIEAIRSRIEIDEKVIGTLLSLNGIEKIYLRNSVPVNVAKKYVDDYEITPGYRYELKNGRVYTIREPWVIKDDAGEKSYSLLPAVVTVGLIKQITMVLDL